MPRTAGVPPALTTAMKDNETDLAGLENALMANWLIRGRN